MNLTGDYYPMECARLSEVDALIDINQAHKTPPQKTSSSSQPNGRIPGVSANDNLPKQTRQVSEPQVVGMKEQPQKDGQTAKSSEPSMPSNVDSYKSKPRDANTPVVSYSNRSGRGSDTNSLVVLLIISFCVMANLRQAR